MIWIVINVNMAMFRILNDDMKPRSNAIREAIRGDELRKEEHIRA